MCDNCKNVSDFVNKNCSRTLEEMGMEFVDFVSDVTQRSWMAGLQSTVEVFDSVLFNTDLDMESKMRCLARLSRQMSEAYSDFASGKTMEESLNGSFASEAEDDEFFKELHALAEMRHREGQ